MTFTYTRTPPYDQCIFCGRVQQLDPTPYPHPDDGFIYSGICTVDGFLLDATVPLEDLTDEERDWCESQRDRPSFRMMEALGKMAGEHLEHLLIHGSPKPNP